MQDQIKRNRKVSRFKEVLDEDYGERVTVSATVGRTFESRVISLVTEEKPENQEPVEDESVLAIGRARSRAYPKDKVSG